MPTHALGRKYDLIDVGDVQTAAAFGQTNHPTRAEGRHDRRAPQTSDTIHHERKCRHVEDQIKQGIQRPHRRGLRDAEDPRRGEAPLRTRSAGAQGRRVRALRLCRVRKVRGADGKVRRADREVRRTDGKVRRADRKVRRAGGKVRRGFRKSSGGTLSPIGYTDA